jgi:hypothetical protein
VKEGLCGLPSGGFAALFLCEIYFSSEGEELIPFFGN